MHILISDVETTGLNKEDDKIIQIAWQEVTDELEVVSEFVSTVNPLMAVPCDAAGVNGLRTELLQDSPTIDEIKFPEGEVFSVCHNLSFDLSFLQRHMNVTGGLCTMLLSRRVFKDSPDHKLSTLSCFLGMPLRGAHDALEDVRTTRDLLQQLLNATDLDLYDLSAWFEEPFVYDVMPFGKHRGELVANIPKQYLSWLSRQPDLDQDTRTTVNFYLNK